MQSGYPGTAIAIAPVSEITPPGAARQVMCSCFLKKNTKMPKQREPKGV